MKSSGFYRFLKKWMFVLVKQVFHDQSIQTEICIWAQEILKVFNSFICVFYLSYIT